MKNSRFKCIRERGGSVPFLCPGCEPVSPAEEHKVMEWHMLILCIFHLIHNPSISSHHIQWPFLSSHPWPSCYLWSVDQPWLLWWLLSDFGDIIQSSHSLSPMLLCLLFVVGFLLPSADDLVYDLILGPLYFSLSILSLSISYHGLYQPSPLFQWFLTLQPYRFLFWAAILNLQITTRHLSLDVFQRQHAKVDGYCHPFSQISFKPKFFLSSTLKPRHLP